MGSGRLPGGGGRRKRMGRGRRGRIWCSMPAFGKSSGAGMKKRGSRGRRGRRRRRMIVLESTYLQTQTCSVYSLPLARFFFFPLVV
jgi:hypothetical protein